MNRRQQTQDKRNQNLVAVLDAHPAATAAVPAFADAAAALRQRLGLVQPAVAQQLHGRQAKGATRAKNDLETPLVPQLVKAANALHLLHKKAGRPELAFALHLRPSDYTKMAQPALAAEAQDVAEQLAEYLKDLAPYGYQKGADTALAAQVAAYAASLPGNRTATDRGKVGTATVRTVFRDLGTFLDDEFRPALELLVDTEPELYRLLREALRVGGGNGKKNKSGKGVPTEPAK